MPRKHIQSTKINYIRGLKGKINEFMLPLHIEVPQLICLTEYHLKNYEMDVTPISKYKLGAYYCRNELKNGGICIYLLETLKFLNTDLQKHCKEQDIEIISLNKKNVIIFSIYRVPSGNFDYFLNILDTILRSLHNYKMDFILCGDINMNYLETSNKKKQSDNLLSTYNLTSTVNFPTRIENNCVTLIDNIFIDKEINYTIKPCINGLSDHDTLYAPIILDTIHINTPKRKGGTTKEW
jgi:exonuclease III